MKTLDFYLNQPWTIKRSERDDDGLYVSLTIEELPGFVVAGSEEELEREFWEALRSHVLSYLEDGEEPPTVRTHRQPFPKVTTFKVADQADRNIRPTARDDPYSANADPLPSKSDNLQLA